MHRGLPRCLIRVRQHPRQAGYRWRVRWVLGALAPLCPASSPRLGACATRPPPAVHGLPVRRRRRPFQPSALASRCRDAFPLHAFPPALPIQRRGSRVRQGSRTRHEGGGVWRAAPAARCGSPGSRQGRAGVPGGPWPGLPWLWPCRGRRSPHGGQDWRAAQPRSARGSWARRALHAAGDAPGPASAQHHLVAAWLRRMVPCRGRLLTRAGGLERCAPRAPWVPGHPRCFPMLPCRFHGAPRRQERGGWKASAAAPC